MPLEDAVSIVIVNYNAGDLLARCLGFVASQTYPHWEAIVVDNASHDGSLRSIMDFESLTLLRNAENKGFATAQNQGLHVAQGSYLMPLNFDIRMSPTFLEEMVQAIQGEPRIGSVCGKLLRMTAAWEPMGEIDSTGLLLLPSGVPTSRGHGELDCGQFDDKVQVFGAQGAAPLYRREMLADIEFAGQFFDESFFMWYEDVDLDWRAYLRGWDCRFAPKAIAYHLGHAPERRDVFYVSTTIRNRWLMLLSNASGSDLATNWSRILAYEFSVLRYVLRSGLFGAYVKALRECLARLPATLRKRRWVQSQAVRRSWMGSM